MSEDVVLTQKTCQERKMTVVKRMGYFEDGEKASSVALGIIFKRENVFWQKSIVFVSQRFKHRRRRYTI